MYAFIRIIALFKVDYCYNSKIYDACKRATNNSENYIILTIIFRVILNNLKLYLNNHIALDNDIMVYE